MRIKLPAGFRSKYRHHSEKVIRNFLLSFALLYATLGNAQVTADVIKSDTFYAMGLDTVIFGHTQKLERAYKVISKWESFLITMPDTSQIVKDLVQIDSQTNRLISNLPIPQYSKNLRYLRGNLILSTIALEKLSSFEDRIKKLTQQLITYDNAVKATGFIGSYNAIPGTYKTDTVLSKQQDAVVQSWSLVKYLSNQSLTQLGSLQLRITKSFIKAEFANTIVIEMLRDFNKSIYTNPVPLIGTPKTHPIYMDVKAEANFSISFIGTMLTNFFENNRRLLFANLLLFILFAFITFNNHRILISKTEHHDLAMQLAPMIVTRPLATAFSIGFFLSPLMYRNVPAVVAELMVLGQLIGITFLIYKRVDKKIFWRWFALCFLFLRFGFMNLLVGISWEARWGLVGLNLGSIYIIWSSYKILLKERQQKSWMLTALITITIIQQVAAVALNFAGYPDAALMQSVNSIISLTLAFSITLSIQIIEEFLNTVDIRLMNHQFVPEDEIGQLKRRAHPYLVIIGLAFWVFGVLYTLNLDKSILNEIQKLLEAKQEFGSASFTYGNIVTFCLIFLASVWISRLSSILIDLFTTRNSDNTAYTHLKNGKIFLQLLILAAGLVFAFIASGIPMERLTIILGALSVGIGLGLQHLVNNLVAGIIIAIEKPLKIGDVISMDNYSGTVTEIGLRSTIVLGPNGHKIYIPNGEFLSSPLVNRSPAKNGRSVSFTFLASEATNIERLKALVAATLANTENILPAPAGSIKINNSTDKGILVEVVFWIARNTSESNVRDAFLEDLVQRLQDAKISFGSKSRGGIMNIKDEEEDTGVQNS